LKKSTQLNTHEYRYTVICNHQVASSKPAAGTNSKRKSPALTGWAFLFSPGYTDPSVPGADAR
jgi:hypothetical protein